MDDIQYELLEIDLADIYHYTYRIDLGNLSEEVAEEILDRIDAIIPQKSDPVICYKERVLSEDKEFEDYYNRRIDRYTNADTIRKRYTVGYFFFGEDIYQYKTSIILTPEDQEFDFFFALKLRQYGSGLIHIPAFLQYHLEKSFEKSLESLSKFIKILFRQYETDLIDELICATAIEWIEDQKKEDEDGLDQESKRYPRSLNSFMLKKRIENIRYFDDSFEFKEFLIAMKKEKFIHPDTAYQQFTMIFQNSAIASDRRIIWVGSNVELKWFISILNYKLQLIESLGQDIWAVTQLCFVDKEGQEFTIKQLKRARGKRKSREDKLMDILSPLAE